MQQILDTKSTIIYGPVNSRRLGKSLGVNILPKGIKYCTFNCVYCHYGWTKVKPYVNSLPEGISFPDVDEIRNALIESLCSLNKQGNLPAYITFSGNGEPTLHPDFPEVVNMVKEIRDELSPASKTAILSNSTEVSNDVIREALCLLDIRIMKLDWGDQETFSLYNKPYPEIALDKIVDGLIQLSNIKPIYIQTLFASGKKGNLNSDNIERWISHITKIKPETVQIYSLSRGYPEKEIEPTGKDVLVRISNLLKENGIDSLVY